MNAMLSRPASIRVCLALCAIGCTPDFTPASEISDLRVLAVRSDPAGVAPGASATLTTLVADPRGEGRELVYVWEACVDEDPNARIPILTSIDCARAVDLPALGNEPSLTYDVPPEIADIEELRLFIDQSGILGLPVRLRVWPAEAPEEDKIAIFPVPVLLEGKGNTNPELQGLLKDGKDWPEAEPLVIGVGEVTELGAGWPATDEEEFVTVTDGTGKVLERREVLAVSWFASVGEFEEDVSSASKPTVVLQLKQMPPTGTTPRLWAILSDGRGGFDWTVRDIQIR